MKRLSFSIVSVGVVALCIDMRDSQATLFRDWADEFVGGTVECNSQVGTCNMINRWIGPVADEADVGSFPPRWGYVGNQGANAGGRANAREKIMFRFREVDPTISVSATTTLSRYRVTSPPAEGSVCTVNGVFIASAAQTVSSLGFADADFYIYNRLLPVLNFSAETAPPGTTVGYHSLLHFIITSPFGGDQQAQDGCYKIAWVN